MDEKDLKKLSRLELLELLLDESKENEELKSEIADIKKAAEKDSEEIRRISEKLNTIETGIKNLQTVVEKNASADYRRNANNEDTLLFNSLVEFYKSHMYLTSVFPKAIKEKLLLKIKRL